MNHPFTRRDFLKFGAMLPALSLADRAAFAVPPQSRSVIVVGAGMAGLSAARALKASGFEVVVVEGRDRFGGRIVTDRSFGLSLDLGASWIHGPEGNPISELAREFKVETVETDYDSLALYNFDGRKLSDARIDGIETRFEAVMEQVERFRVKQRRKGEDVSIQQAVSRAWTTELPSKQDALDFQYAVNAIIEHESASDIADLSLLHWDQDDEFEGEDVLFPGGYDQITTGMARGLDIRLGQIVKKIEHASGGVKITTDKTVFEASLAVVTLPLGVLKSGSVEFSPALPERKRAALRNLRMGVLNKTYLRFPRVFWDDDVHLLGFISERKGEWAEWINMARYVRKPVLLGFNAGDYGRRIEEFSDDRIVDEAMKTLKTMYGPSIPSPEAVRITRWGKDGFAGGSYSYIPPGATGDDYDALAEPVGDRLFFAGEATSRRYPATVHGAFLSGERAARQVSNLSKKSR